METTKKILMIAVPVVLSAALFSGCYTQLASTQDEEENGYNDNRSYAAQEPFDSTNNDAGNYYDDDYRRSCMGYFYCVPTWQASWYYGGCVYPTWSYWDAWWMTAGWAYPAYYYYGGYHPYYGGYWHRHNGYYGHYSSQPQGVRSGGFTRANFNGRNEFDFARSSNIDNTGNMIMPSAGRTTSAAARTSGAVSTSTRAATSQPSGTYRTSTVGRSSRTYSPSIQQPQYRNQSNGTRNQTRSARAASIRSYNAPSTRSSSAPRSTPNFSAPSTRVAPNSSPAPSRDNGNGGGGQSGGSRSGGGRR
ncbi:MAG TPA: hypothetical protein VMU30_10970 [Bacteroidota bacterium]|nr:hypothetical protein [Bacteroidota bacterium]